jgi:hypothetical protein
VRLVSRSLFASLLIVSVLDSSSRIFECLGFEIANIVGSVPDASLSPPDIDPNSHASRIARSKLLRGWVELSAWTADFSRRFGRLTIYLLGVVWQLTTYIRSPGTQGIRELELSQALG